MYRILLLLFLTWNWFLLLLLSPVDPQFSYYLWAGPLASTVALLVEVDIMVAGRSRLIMNTSSKTEEYNIPPEVERYLNELQPQCFLLLRKRAVNKLAHLKTNNDLIFKTLSEVGNSDPNEGVRKLAKKTLSTTIHQELLNKYVAAIQHPVETKQEQGVAKEENQQELFPVDVLKHIQNLYGDPTTRIRAVEQLGKLIISYPQLIGVLITVRDTDVSEEVRAAAAISLMTKANQEILQRYPDLASGLSADIATITDKITEHQAHQARLETERKRQNVLSKPSFVLFVIGIALSLGGIIASLDSYEKARSEAESLASFSDWGYATGHIYWVPIVLGIIILAYVYFKNRD
jgi:hypothetical protein